MASAYPIRHVTQDESQAFALVKQHAFHGGPPSEESRAHQIARTEWDRTLAAFDGETMAGTAAVYSFRMCVPGAMADVAGVSQVSVLPSHRRRGILSALMRRQLDDLHAGGEAVAALFASEAGIYRRFGYGRASWHAGYALRGREGALAPGAPADPRLRLRIAEPQAARAELAKVYEVLLAERPGFFARSDPWWDRVLAGPGPREGSSPLRCLLAEDDKGPRAYALYSARDRWDEDTFLPEGEMEIREAFAVDAAATAAIWADLLSRDLLGDIHARMRPADDPLAHLLADPRRLRPRMSDGLWIRLVDTGHALTQRRYTCPVDIVIEVDDEFCPWNHGRWRLAAGPAAGSATGSAGPAGHAGGPGAGFAATCERTSADADIELPAHALGAVYLGGTRLGSLAAAGLVTQRRPGAVAALSAAMSWDPAPWCPTIF